MALSRKNTVGLFVRREEEVIDVSITVTGRKMPVTDALREYAEDEKSAIP